MPELPEVETIRRVLQSLIVGRHIENVVVYRRDLRVPVTSSFETDLEDSEIVALERRAKLLVVRLSSQKTIFFHLGMSGKLLYRNRTSEQERHEHIRVIFGDGDMLSFIDPRRFGMALSFKNVDDGLEELCRGWGPEPFSREFSAAYLNCRSRAVGQPVKNFLMNNAVVVGVGNIYANEALHRAAIHPQAPARRLSLQRWRRLHKAVLETLENAIEAGGSTIEDFRDGADRSGYFQNDFQVYQREGEYCLRCGADRKIRRLKLAGRSAFYCPGCQHY